jgi:RNA-directed DNA polymerase
MSRLPILRQATNLSDLAKILGFTPMGLSCVIYQITDAEKYRVFTIPKKDGGTRTIKAPTPRLSLLQSRLAELLTECVSEITLDNPVFHTASHGFRKDRTIISNANPHRKRRYVFNVDIADFFGYINFGRVRGFFIKDRNFSLTPSVATLIGQIACYENALPQGSPCSPIISNLIANILDVRLLGLAKHCKCTYSRYADDLTFSTNEVMFPVDISEQLVSSQWVAGKRLVEIVQGTGFMLNPAKTRMSLRKSRQMVTGLVINQKPNIRQSYYRAMCNSLFKTGRWYMPRVISGAATPPASNIKTLEGMLSHIYFVKARRDRTHKINKSVGYVAPKAFIDQYRKFLFYRYFVFPSHRCL